MILSIGEKMCKLIKKSQMPKQFFYWLQKLRIERETTRKYQSKNYFFSNSQRRKFRLIEEKEYFIFEISEKYETFDRWANSREVSIAFHYDVKEKTFTESVQHFLNLIEHKKVELPYPVYFNHRQ